MEIALFSGGDGFYHLLNSQYFFISEYNLKLGANDLLEGEMRRFNINDMDSKSQVKGINR